jgi:hypothetical protein
MRLREPFEVAQLVAIQHEVALVPLEGPRVAPQLVQPPLPALREQGPRGCHCLSVNPQTFCYRPVTSSGNGMGIECSSPRLGGRLAEFPE